MFSTRALRTAVKTSFFLLLFARTLNLSKDCLVFANQNSCEMTFLQSQAS